MPAAAACTSSNVDLVFAVSAGLTRTATRTALGTSSWRRLSRFAANSVLKRLIHVRLPSGLARLDTRPRLTGSWDTMKRVGIVVVAALAANAAGGPPVEITATPRCTRSAANSANRSLRFSAKTVQDRQIVTLNEAGFLQALMECAQANSNS